MRMTKNATRTRRPNMAAARRAIAAANAHRVIVEGGFVTADAKVGAAQQAVNLNAALTALDIAGIAYERDTDYPTWLARLT
jgi:hypothetical protein